MNYIYINKRDGGGRVGAGVEIEFDLNLILTLKSHNGRYPS
jgi:hypothetical protein